MKKRILLIDYYNLFIRCFQIVPVTNDDGEHFGGTFGFLRGMKAAVDQFKPSEVYVVCDGQHSSLRRKLIDKNYKASRKKTWKRGVVKAYDFLNENEQSDNFSMQINRLNQYLSILPVNTISIPYVEADDIIAEIVNTIPEDIEAIIYSTDADYKQLVNDHVFAYNPTAKQLTTKATFFEKHGFLVDNYIYFKVINGDKSDDLPGVSGIGEKTLLKLFPKMAEEHVEDLDEIFDHCRHAIGSKSKTYTKAMKAKYQDILNAEELIRKNYIMMQLNDVNISLQSKDNCKNVVERKPNSFNRMKLRLMFMEDRMNTQMKSFSDWSRVFSSLMLKG